MKLGMFPFDDVQFITNAWPSCPLIILKDFKLQLIKRHSEPAVLACAFNPSIQQAEAGGSL